MNSTHPDSKDAVVPVIPRVTRAQAVRILAWVAVLSGCLGLLGTAASVERTHHVQGALYRTQEPVTVVAPATARVLSILVSEGATVRRGQTVALLDPEPGEVRLDELERELYLTRAAALCIELAPTPLTGLAKIQVPNGTLTGAAGNLAKIAAQSCQDSISQLAVQLDLRHRTVQGLKDRLRLVERALGLANQFVLAADGADPQNRGIRSQLSEALNLSLAKNLVEQELEAARAAERLFILTERRSRRDRALDLSQTIAQLEQMIAEADAQQSRLRLFAPRGGAVSAIRRNAIGMKLTSDTTLLLIDPSPDPVFELRFAATSSDLDRFPIGSRAHVRISGLPAGAPELVGHVARFSWTQNAKQDRDQMIGHIGLTHSSIEVLTSTGYGMAVFAPGTAADAEITLLSRGSIGGPLHELVQSIFGSNDDAPTDNSAQRSGRDFSRNSRGFSSLLFSPHLP